MQLDMPGTLRNLLRLPCSSAVESVQAIAKVVELEPSDIRAKVQLAYYRSIFVIGPIRLTPICLETSKR